MVEERILILTMALSPIFVFAAYMFIATFQIPLYHGIIRRMWRDDFRMGSMYGRGTKYMVPKSFLKKYVREGNNRFIGVRMKKTDVYHTVGHQLRVLTNVNIIRRSYETTLL